MTRRIEVDGRMIEIGNPDKLMFPNAGITKRDLVDYYVDVADAMLPHVTDRPVTMHRFPDGIDADGFYQKETPGHFPDWIRTETVEKRDGEVDHVVIESAATLAYLADQACITPHVWLSTVTDLELPDRVVFDLDPPEDSEDLGLLRLAARRLRELLDDIGLECRLMTTGSSGYHVVVPVTQSLTFDQVRDFAHRVADVAARRDPDQLTTEQRVDGRDGRVFVDYLRNSYAQTTVAPYAVRALDGAPIATPIDWSELDRAEPRSYTVANLFKRLGQKPDPWSSDGISPQSLEAARRHLEDLQD